MDDFGNELEEIKREIVESRSLSIKTNNLVNALSADVNSIAKRQQSYERRITLNSAAAYLGTVVVLLILAKVTVDARVEAERANTKERRDKLEQLEKEIHLMQQRDEVRVRAERQAASYYGLILAEKRREVIKRFEEVSKLPLSKTERTVFEQAHERFKNELSLIAYQEGLDHIRAGRWHEAEQSLDESLKQKGNAAHAPHARFQLARSLRKLGRQREAIPMLMKLSEASADKEVMDDATFLLAEAQIDIQAWNDAKSTLRSFIRRFPNSASANDARIKLADIQLHH